EQENALADYGMNLGLAFQIADDVLDYVSDASTLGKNIGDDLAEGKPTLPVIYAIAHSAPAQAASLRRAIETGGLDSLDNIVAAITDSGALEHARERAASYADRARHALNALPKSDARDSLAVLAGYAIGRSS
ncbi:MAG: polyprenyl synthetase family protein, partial [Dokdonella sp.]